MRVATIIIPTRLSNLMDIAQSFVRTSRSTSKLAILLCKDDELEVFENIRSDPYVCGC